MPHIGFFTPHIVSCQNLPPTLPTMHLPTARSAIQVCHAGSKYFTIMHPMIFVHQKTCFHLHWHSIVKLLHGLVVDGYGHLCVSVEGELYVVAGPVLPRRLITRQLQVLAAPTGGRERRPSIAYIVL